MDIKQGWVIKVRRLKNIEFIILREFKNLQLVKYQIVNKKATTNLKVNDFVKLSVLKTEVKNNEGYLQYELDEVLLTVSGVPGPYDYDAAVKQQTINKNRVFHLRTNDFFERFYNYSILKHKIITYFIDNKWVNIESPKIQDLSAESGGSELFAVRYYHKIKYLSQSPQFYKQILANLYDRVYEIGNIYRAEPSDTYRHLAEASCLDVEMSFVTLTNLYEVIMQLLTFADVFKKLNLTPNIPVYDYETLCKLIKKPEGADFNSEELKRISMHVTGFYIIQKYPFEIKPFYVKRNGYYSESFDLYYNELQLASGGIREENYEILKAQITDKKIDFKQMEWYLDNFKYGCKPHGGFGLGLARLFKVYDSVIDIKNAVLFPLSYGNQ